MEENVSYQEIFSEWKNIVPSQSYYIFKSRKQTYNYIAPTNFIVIPQKSSLKYMFSYIFSDKCLKLGSYVLGTKTKLSRDQNFDWGLKILQKWALAIFKYPSQVSKFLPLTVFFKVWWLWCKTSIGWGGAIVDRGIFWTKWGNFGQSKYLEIQVLEKFQLFFELSHKIHPVGQLFGRVLRPQTLRCQCGGHAHFPDKMGFF